MGQGGRASVARAEMLTTEEAEGVAQGALRLALHSDSGRRRSAGGGGGTGEGRGGVGLDRGGLEICRGGREAARSALNHEGVPLWIISDGRDALGKCWRLAWPLAQA